MGKIILQTQSVFLWTGRQEEDLLGFYAVVEVIDVQSIVAFDLCLDEEFIEF